MILFERTKFTATLSVSVGCLLIRLAIHLHLFTLQSVLTLTRYLAITILFTLIIWFTREWYTSLRKLREWTTIPLLHAIRIALTGCSEKSRRGLPIPVFGNEVYSSLSMLRLEGDTGHVYVPFFGLPIVVVTSAQAMKAILCTPHAISKPLSVLPLKLAIEDGLFVSSGDRWKTHRKLLTPAFHFQILKSIMSIVLPQAELLVSKLEQEASSKDDRSVDDVVPYFFDASLNTLFQSSMALDTANESNIENIKQGFTHAMNLVASAACNPFLVLDLIFGFSREGRGCREFKAGLKGLVDEIILKRMSWLRETAKNHSDDSCIHGDETMPSMKREEPFIDIMLREHLKDPEKFTLDDIRAETANFLAAGLDTTVWSISYTLLLLGHHPEVQEKLYRELQQFFDHRDLRDLTPEDLKTFTYLSAVYNESMRLFPPGPLVARYAEEDILIEGKVLPKGCTIYLFMKSLHRDPRYWSDPHRFKPERFLTPLADPFTFLPFSAGARNCPGQKYANIQAKTTLLSIVNKYRIKSITQLDEVVTFGAPVAHTETPIKVRLLPRELANNN